MKIKIDVNEKYTIKLEEVEDFQDSFFSGVYRSALDNLIEIVESSKKAVENSKKSDENSFLRLVSEEKNKGNNIIAFVGERGSGKSSAMISFVNALKNKKEKLLEKSTKKKINCNLEFLDVIDPSLFEKNDNILEIVVARMFHRFKESFSDNNFNDKNQYAKKKALLEKFESVYKSIKVIQKNEKYSSDDELIEEISNLSSGTNLRKNLRNLVNNYLEFFGKKENQFLVLIIDDFDLNITHGAEMAEWIRKYLFLPNVIIFTALNFNDLFLLIQQNYTKHLEIALKNNQITNSDIKIKSDKYLEKFLPYPRRIFLPEILKDKNIIELTIIDSSNKDIDKPIKEIEDFTSMLLEEKILELLIFKTRLFFYTTTGTVNTLVPTTLREAINFIFFLAFLPSNQFDTNTLAFERYFSDKIFYRKEEIDFIESVPFKDRNKHIARIIIGNNWTSELQKSDFSLIDILYLFENYPKDEKDINFVFSLKTMYSILMNKLLLNRKNDDILTLSIAHNIDYNILKEENKKLFFEPRKFTFDAQKAYNKFEILFLYYWDSNRINERAYSFWISNINLVRYVLLDLFRKELGFYLEIKKLEANNFLKYYNFSGKDKNDFDNLLELLEIINKNPRKNEEILKSLIPVLVFAYDNEKYSDETEFKNRLSDIHRIFKNINAIQNSDKFVDQTDPIIKFQDSLNKLNLTDFYSIEVKIELYNSINEDLKKDDYFEIFEWLYSYFKFFAKNNITIIKENTKENLFVRFLQSFQYEKNKENKKNDTIYDNLSKNEFYITEIPFIGFYFENSNELKESKKIEYSKYDKDKEIKKINEKVVDDYNNYIEKYEYTMKKKLEKWEKSNLWIPINNFDFLSKTFLGKDLEEYLFNISKKEYSSQFMLSIYAVMNKNLNDLNYSQNYFKSHPIINPFFDDSEKSLLFRVLFDFVFKDAIEEID